MKAIHRNGKVLAFYSMPEYESWKESLGGNASGWSIKYYKIIPQSVCSRYGLAIGAAVALFVCVLVWICFPVAYPISKLLYFLLGHVHVALFRRAELKTLVDLHGNEFMRLAYLIGYGSYIERSPVNSASLSMLPWPKLAVWPLVPPDASSEVFEKEKMILQTTPRVKHFGIQRKPLPLEPSLLLREANRRRASLSAGNVFELFDGRSAFIDGLGSDASPRKPPSAKVNTVSMSRTNSSPGNFESCIDRPMRLAEICVAAEHALQNGGPAAVLIL